MATRQPPVDLDQLAREADAPEPGCEAEVAAAEQLFARFVDEKVALALLPSPARELLGPTERWRWCLLHIRCCIVFGWLLCRRPRSFRLSARHLQLSGVACLLDRLGQPPLRMEPLPQGDEDHGTQKRQLTACLLHESRMNPDFRCFDHLHLAGERVQLPFLRGMLWIQPHSGGEPADAGDAPRVAR